MTLSRYPMLAAIAATCLSFIQAQTSAPSTAPGVPSTAPAPSVTPEGDYSGALRPQVHFSPPVGFMNDPNGLFKSSNGTWHLYYQYNPTDVVAGNQHWGHATSDDLYHWVNHPIALYPPNNQSGVFSGSAVVDANNTSGMFNDTTDGVVAIYTLNTPQEQTQNVAFSYDGGYTFTEYTGNPVLSRNSTQFRDPKVFWYDDHWVMVVAFSVDFTIGIYTSPDLLDWSFASNFSHAGLLGLQYECPGLERLPIETFEGEKGQGYAWMLYISINPGAPLGGSIGEYFVGDFNGTHFEAYDAAARIADWGKDNYATQFWYAPDEDPTSIAWASNWQYTNRVPTADEGFRSIMSLPRHNYLTNATRIGWVLGSRPVYLGPVLESQLASSDNLINDTLSVDYTNVTSNAIYFQINLTYPSPLPTLAATASLNFTFSSSKSGENVTGGYLLAGENAGAIWLDRGNTDGFRDAFFTDKFSLTQATPPFARQIEGVIDRTVLELFLDGGHFSSTSLFYPKEMLDRMEVVTAGLVDGVDVSVAVWGLKSGWQ